MYVRPEVSDSSVIEYDIKTSSRSCLRFSLVEPSFDVVSIRNRYLICDMKLQGKKCQNILLWKEENTRIVHLTCSDRAAHVWTYKQ